MKKKKKRTNSYFSAWFSYNQSQKTVVEKTKLLKKSRDRHLKRAHVRMWKHDGPMGEMLSSNISKWINLAPTNGVRVLTQPVYRRQRTMCPVACL